MPPIIHRKNKQHLDSMVIGQGHNLMAGYIPSQVGARAFNDNYYAWANPTPESISQFGLFGSDINYNTYYPELSQEDLKPRDEEFIEPVFRLLSATIVSKNWNPTDFGVNGVLKASMNLLLGQTVNCDHETNIGNAIGSVSQVMWQEPYRDKGIYIPGGINGVLKIDGKANPRIARGILMEPPSIHSNSVTVQFKWDKSHPSLDDDKFYSSLGTYDKKGEMIRRMVTEIVCYRETSLVSHGADNFAQKLDKNGKLTNPVYANRVWSSYEEYENDESRIYSFDDFKDSENYDTTSFINKDNNINNKENDMNEELQKFLESLFGEGYLTLADGQEHSTEVALSQIRELVSSNASLQEQVNNLTTERDTLNTQVTSLNDQVANLTARAEIGSTYIASLREEAVNTYKKVAGEKADESIINMLNADTTSHNTVKSLLEDYQRRLEEKFPMTCSKCGSHEVSRSSSLEEIDETRVDTTSNNDTEGKEVADVAKRIYNKKMKG